MDSIVPNSPAPANIRSGSSVSCRALCLLVGLWLGVAGSLSGAGIYEEYSIKAVFIYKFTRYIEWPEQAFSADSSPLRLCVYGKNPFGKALFELRGQRAGNRTLEIRNVRRLGGISPCHILFVGTSNQAELPQILAVIDDASILTIGDTHYFTRHGGMIGLRLLQGKVSLDINLRAAQEANLSISSKLLSVAKIVSRRK